MTNTNPETGIRYGTIYLNNLDPDTADHLWTMGENISEAEAYKEARAEVEAEVREEWTERDTCEEGWDDSDLESEVDSRMDRVEINIEEPYIEGEVEGVKYGISFLGGAPLVWIYFSPHLAKAKLCSPCVPGAIDLDSLDEDGFEGYSIPADWRDKNEN